MTTVSHAVPSRMTHTVAALYGHADETLLAWQQACVQAAEALQPRPDPAWLVKALTLAQDGAVALEADGTAQVTSSGTRYHLDADGTCHCPDAQHRGVPCKHALAVHIHQQALAQLVPGATPQPAAPAQRPAPPHRSGLSDSNRKNIAHVPYLRRFTEKAYQQNPTVNRLNSELA